MVIPAPLPRDAFAAAGRRWLRRSPVALAALSGLLLVAGPLQAQDLVGCRLVEATLQCLPGLDASPQQQIRILKAEEAEDQQLEAWTNQTLAGLRQVLLDGVAMEGGLLRARLSLEPGVSLAAVTYHWYRHAPGRLNWELIPAAQGDSYTISRNDIAYDLMVVALTPGPTGIQRISSAPVGPVRVANPLAQP